MRVKEIRVEGLFDTFDHVIPLNLNDHITIIHGANGFGKTILLQMVHGLLHGSIDSIIQVPFKRFEVSFDDNSRIWVEKSENDGLTEQIQINNEKYTTPLDIQKTHLNSLAPKIQLFKDIINKRFLYKTVEVSSDLGLFITDRMGKVVPTTVLSSGEQHVLILFYQLIFEISHDSLIVIDDPEQSLHIAWQQHFLKDLQSIIALSPFDVLMATHSPQIIHDRWDLTVELKGPSSPAKIGGDE